MRIKESKVRQEIRRKLNEGDGSENPFDGIPGIFLLEQRNWDDDDFYRCAQWVFRTYLLEP